MELGQHRRTLDHDRLDKENSHQYKDDDDQENVAEQPQTFEPKALSRLSVKAHYINIPVVGRRDKPEVELVFLTEIEHNRPSFDDKQWVRRLPTRNPK